MLRSSAYLTTKKCAIVFSIYGQPLSHDLINFTANVSSKRDEYFAKALDISLQNITDKNLEVVSNEVLDDFLYYNENDSETDE